MARSLYKHGVFTKSIPEETRTITVPSLSGLYTTLPLGQNMRPNRLSHIYIYIYKSSMNTVLFVNATIGFSENLFLVMMAARLKKLIYISKVKVILNFLVMADQCSSE